MTSHTLFEWFARSAEAHPHTPALEVADTALTYAQLLSAAEQTSARLVAELGRPPQRIGLLTSRSLAGCVTYLAAQRLGAVTVPLNPGVPVIRNLGITADAGLELTVVDGTAGDGLDDYLRSADVAILDLRHGLPSGAGPVPPPVQRDSHDTAYVIFTSGTSGRPKGVPITHANVSSFLEAVIPRYRFRPGARVSQTFEMAFDGSILAMFGAWGSGATLCPATRSDVLTPVRFINAKRLTHWLSVPSLISFAKRLRALPPASMPTLELSSFGGEGLTLEQVRDWAAAAPASDVINCYGPTETTVIVTANRLSAARLADIRTSNGSVPIGHVFEHVEHVLLDDRLEPTDDGELCLRGPQRFSGYLDPAENTGRFLRLDGGKARVHDGSEPLTAEHWYRTGDRVRREHGDLVHIGRIDDQVKIWGHRVELAEIEATLRGHPSVTEAVVMSVPSDQGETDLHALYTGERLDDRELSDLLALLPVYMRPRHFHHRDHMPLTNVDKVDRRRLMEELHLDVSARL